jgi:hypothetical protein
MTLPIRIDITVAESEQQYDLTVVETNIPIAVDVGTAIVASIAEDYDGEYDITPSSAAQVFQTEGKRVLHDFVVEPIPQNYGLITYNGSTITVS